MNETKTMTVKEMIPEKAWPEIEALLDAGKRTAADFKPVLLKYQAEMEAKGVVPEYAAYVLEFVANQTGGK
jgi:hypothetical protein